MSVSTNKLLSRLVSSVESSRFTLICDDLDSNSKQLMDSFISNRLKDFHLCVVIVESDPNKYFNSIKQYFNTNNIQLFDIFSKYNTIESNISEHLVQSLFSVTNESIVFIDSLTPLLIKDSLHQVCRSLNQLSNRFQQLICVLHVDSHSELINESIEGLANCVIHLSRNEDKGVKCNKAMITYRKPHRKTHFSVQQTIELFNIQDFNVKYVTPLKTTKTTSESSPTISDPTLNLPFNLNLKDDEIKAKNDLLLPYIKTQKESKVYYEFDKNDDIDEEDPDDDLDI